MGGEKEDCTFPDDVKTSPLLLYLLRTSFPCPNLRTITTAARHNCRCHLPAEKASNSEDQWKLVHLHHINYKMSDIKE
ncbi:hypothetical protein Bca4012_039098 [Brassica carinata]